MGLRVRVRVRCLTIGYIFKALWAFWVGPIIITATTHVLYVHRVRVKVRVRRVKG